MQLEAPTSLSVELVKEYQELCKKEHGVDLSYDEAHKEGLELVEFYIALLQAEIASQDDQTLE